MVECLAAPITSKHIKVSVNGMYYVVCSSVQGWRPYMEDEHTVLLETQLDRDASYFGVFDGHSGSTVAKLAKNSLHIKILTQRSYQTGNIERALKEVPIHATLFFGARITALFIVYACAGYMSLDLEMQQDTSIVGGSTAVVIILKENNLYCANAGDSRAVAFLRDRTIALSVDHKPLNPHEKVRIQNAGFDIIQDRINGCLAISRSLGDFNYKSNPRLPHSLQAVSCLPEVRHDMITSEWQFILLASDGVYDVFSTEEVGSYVHSRISRGLRPEEIMEQLLDNCISAFSKKSRGDSGSDNMTALLIVLKKNMSKFYMEILEKPPASIYVGPCLTSEPNPTAKAGTSTKSSVKKSSSRH